jgi:hypothetical protein
MVQDPFTYFFYTSFLFISVLLTAPLGTLKAISVETYTSLWNRNTKALILIFTLILGLRYDVGQDYLGYMDWYVQLTNTGIYPVDNEFGFVFLNKILAYLGAHFAFLFIIIGFCQILFLLKSLKKFPFLLPWYLFFFFTTLMLFSSMNIMRQMIAYFAFFCGINLALDKRYRQAFFVLLIGFSFHKSILVAVLAYPFLFKDWNKNRVLQLGLYLTSIFILPNFLTIIMQATSPYVDMLGYSYYVENLDLMAEITMQQTTGEGFGLYLFILIDAIIIFHSKELKETFKKYHFSAYYNLYFIGLILSNLFSKIFVLVRISEYFTNFRCLILSFLCYYLIAVKSTDRHWVNHLILTVIIITLLAFFYRGIYNSAAKTAPFNFVF